MRKIFYALLVFNVHLLANNENIDLYWNKAIEQTNSLWNKTKQVSLDTVDGAKNITAESIDTTKNIFSKGKKIFLEKTLLASINVGLDYNNSITANNLTINDENGSLSLLITLEGEDKELTLDVHHFDWDITENKEFIILENIDASLDIAWLNYFLKEYLRKNNGYIKIKNSLAKETFLRSLKVSIKTSYIETDVNSQKEQNGFQMEAIKNLIKNNDEKKNDIKNNVKNDKNILENLVKEFYDETYIKPIYIKQNGKEIECNFSLAGSEKGLLLTLEDFDWATANEKKLIVIGNIQFKNCNKPWIESLLHKHYEQILFQYDPLFEKMLTDMKAKTQGSIEKPKNESVIKIK